ncbi:hypothetical protein KP509_16G028300 [Ceratopteris richardii]|uniref:Tf2-1-like SH3-like domain-containing protein n=1 Tax=Ceratopteris richardii TaxID=49495 RepID=A0A8T2SZK0_CERRI|nr:hypothetical protein KP509_16G028300 [Ceratopteris richardii]
MQATLKIAQFNVQQCAKRMNAFVDPHRTPQTFQDGDRVFLHVPLHSSLIVLQKPKLSPRFCEPWRVIKKISDLVYKLQLLDDCKFHPILHVSKLRPYIYQDDYWKLWNCSIPNYLVAWTSHPIIYATWELEATIHKHFLSLITEESD